MLGAQVKNPEHAKTWPREHSAPFGLLRSTRCTTATSNTFRFHRVCVHADGANHAANTWYARHLLARHATPQIGTIRNDRGTRAWLAFLSCLSLSASKLHLMCAPHYLQRFQERGKILAHPSGILYEATSQGDSHIVLLAASVLHLLFLLLYLLSISEQLPCIFKLPKPVRGAAKLFPLLLENLLADPFVGLQSIWEKLATTVGARNPVVLLLGIVHVDIECGTSRLGEHISCVRSWRQRVMQKTREREKNKEKQRQRSREKERKRSTESEGV